MCVSASASERGPLAAVGYGQDNGVTFIVFQCDTLFSLPPYVIYASKIGDLGKQQKKDGPHLPCEPEVIPLYPSMFLLIFMSGFFWLHMNLSQSDFEIIKISHTERLLRQVSALKLF